jgi:hypothetical protein
MADLLFVCDRASGLFASPSLQAPARSRGSVEGSTCLVIILPQAFSQKNEGVEPCHVFLVGRIMVLGELPTGQFEWGPGSRLQGSGMAQLVTDSIFLTSSSYSS